MSGVKPRILVADDDEAIADALQIMLEDEGYEVEVVLDGGSIHKIAQNPPDLLLLDIWMSGKNGREICQELRLNEETRHLPIILISANKDTAQIAREAGADGFISKPFDIDDLLEKVANFFPDK